MVETRFTKPGSGCQDTRGREDDNGMNHTTSLDGAGLLMEEEVGHSGDAIQQTIFRVLGPRGESHHAENEEAIDGSRPARRRFEVRGRLSACAGIGHSSWVFARRPGIGVMSNTCREPRGGPRRCGSSCLSLLPSWAVRFRSRFATSFGQSKANQRSTGSSNATRF